MSGKYVNMNGYSYFKIPQYFHKMDEKKFVTSKIDYIYPRLMCLFFVNVIVNKEIPKITSYIKGKIIVLNGQYLSEWLNLSLKSPKVFYR